MRELEGQVALVTGGGRGIGAAIARELARRGAQIVISSRTQSELDSVLDSVRAEGGIGHSLVTDAMDREQVRALGLFALGLSGRIDILINNVGGAAPASSYPTGDPDDAFVADLTLNLISAVWLTRTVQSSMREAGYGRIINIGSGASKRTGAPLAYATAKHAIVGFTRQLAADMARSGVTVNCLCPGWTNTALADFKTMASAMGTTEEAARAYAEGENLQGRVLEPDELCGMAGLLASPSSGGITGQVISVDGGYKV